jgi:hypothetical protein
MDHAASLGLAHSQGIGGTKKLKRILFFSENGIDFLISR